jgi:RNA polymerase-binding transcription factor DksA
MTVTMAEQLAPLERLHLREALQDHWRDEVRRITLLSLEMYDDLDAEEPIHVLDAEAGRDIPTTDALEAARRRLTDLERALHRLDDGSYGRCTHCGTVLPYQQLTADPLTVACNACRFGIGGGHRIGATGTDGR